MSRTASLPLVIGLVLMLAACGRMGTLRHTSSMKPVPVATGQSRPATAEELIRPSMQSRPQRNFDILSQSERRPEDPFDQRPGAENGR